MNILAFKKLVADYMNRDQSLFDVDAIGLTDKLLFAINNAKAYAQRRLNFELARATVDVVVNKTNGGDLSTAKLHGTNTPIRILSLERGFIPASDGSGLVPVDIMDRNNFVKRLQRRTEGIHDPTDRKLGNCASPIVYVRQGNIVTVQPYDNNLFNEASMTAVFDVIQWMPPYDAAYAKGTTTVSQVVYSDNYTLIDSATSYYLGPVLVGDYCIVNGYLFIVKEQFDPHSFTLTPTFSVYGYPTIPVGATYTFIRGVIEDFFLIECIDWMLWRSIQELNLFLKEDQRVVVSAALMEDAWMTVSAWNTRLASTYDDYNLD